MLARVYICVRDGGESEVNKMRILLSPEFYIKLNKNDQSCCGRVSPQLPNFKSF